MLFCCAQDSGIQAEWEPWKGEVLRVAGLRGKSELMCGGFRRKKYLREASFTVRRRLRRSGRATGHAARNEAGWSEGLPKERDFTRKRRSLKAGVAELRMVDGVPDEPVGNGGEHEENDEEL